MLSILIVNWNTRDLLRSCLASILKFPPDCPFEVIVVDNASSDQSAAMVKSEFPQVKLLEPGSNTGYAHGNNLAFSASQGDYLLTLNPDTEFEDLSISVCRSELEANHPYGVLALRLVGPHGETQKSVRGFPTLLGVLGAWAKLDTVLPYSVFGSYSLPGFDYGHAGPAPQPMGTFLLFRRAALAAVGDPSRPFDEQFPIFFNEVDLLYRLHRAGHPCWYTPNAHIRHQHGASTGQVRKSMIWESHRSLVRYLRKHLKGPQRTLLPVVALIAWVAAFIRAKGVYAGFRPEHHDL